MCGIAGIVAFSDKGRTFFKNIDSATVCLSLRGPDAKGTFINDDVAFGHTRLSIIDTSDAANQPMSDGSGRYIIIFNGEFFNYKEHRQVVLDAGYKLRTDSDTEVLLYLYIMEGEKCLQRVNGFFALAIYDAVEKSVFVARDRIGVKPLLVYQDEDKLMFASEMKSMVAMGVTQQLDANSLLSYFQLNYIPGPESVYTEVKKLDPGCFLKCRMQNAEFKVEKQQYYSIKQSTTDLSYEAQQQKLVELMDKSVQRRLIADVPVGAFLSGGIDSSIVVALAAQHTDKLQTFSIGFSDEPMFDETSYANLIATKYNTDHHVFKLTTEDLFSHLHDMLDYIDEPFADSSALNVFLLSKETRKYVKVALSGDGGDELFGGYYKHLAEIQFQKKGVVQQAVKMLAPFWKQLPQSRNTRVGNTIRQLNRFAEGSKLSSKERYWRWASLQSEEDAQQLLNVPVGIAEYRKRKEKLLMHIKNGSINDVLFTDAHLVLVNDMLVKTDMMSMANSLEVRNPFLDYTVVDFAFSVPQSSKIYGGQTKRIVRDAFRNLLSPEIYARKKQGFEVPLLKWFRSDLKSMITDDLLSTKFVAEQNIFNADAVNTLLRKLFSNNPGDSVAQVWALIVFQKWWKKYQS